MNILHKWFAHNPMRVSPSGHIEMYCSKCGYESDQVYTLPDGTTVLGFNTFCSIDDTPDPDPTPVMYAPSSTPPLRINLLKKKCECGAKRVGVKDYEPGHSSWCPVKERT